MNPQLYQPLKPKILVIVGPTASGKTSLSISLAKQFDGEVISADSRQVYRGLDLGTGKVTPEEMDGIPHHLLDVADPTHTYTAHDFVRDGRAAINGILSRGKLPIIVGGTFFYIDALLGRTSSAPVPPDDALRSKLEALSNEELYAEIKVKDPNRALTIDSSNKRRLVRALEIIEALGSVPKTDRDESYDALTIGIEVEKERLKENIKNRLLTRLQSGMVEEVEELHKNGLSYERLEELGIEYKCIAHFLMGKITKEKMIEEIDTKSRQYAKRQMTWLKRDKVNAESREGALGYKVNAEGREGPLEDKVKEVNIEDREAGLGHAEGREGALGYTSIMWVDKDTLEKTEKVVAEFLEK